MDLHHETTVEENVSNSSSVVLKNKWAWERTSPAVLPTEGHGSIRILGKVIRTLNATKDTIEGVAQPSL
jgi:hypothetical protein